MTRIDAATPDLARVPRLALLAVPLQLLLLVALLRVAPRSLNVDAVAYLRLASYYAHGDLELAVTGYWGPLLSCLTAPFLLLASDPLRAGQMAMAVTAMTLLVGASGEACPGSTLLPP